jgi:hypothetical protein
MLSAAATGVWVADRWYSWQSAATGGVVTYTRDANNQVSPAMAGCHFNYNILGTVSTADASLAVGDSYTLHFSYLVDDSFQWLYSPFVVSFWINCSLAGTRTLCVRNTDNTYTCVAEFKVDTANNWEYKEISFPAASAAIPFALNYSLEIFWDLGSGTNFHTTTVNQWKNDNIYTTANAVSILGTIGNKIYITGLDITVGNKARQFQPVPFEVELERCQRWFEKSFDYSVPPQQSAGWSGALIFPQGLTSATYQYFPAYRFAVRKNNVPSITLFNPLASNAQWRTGVSDWASTSALNIYETGFQVSGRSAGYAIGTNGGVHWTASAS